MTHTTTVEERANSGAFTSVFATLDITSLDNANNESFDPAAELGLREVFGVAVLGYEEAASQLIEFDHLENAIYVEGYGGTDPTADTDVGEVRIRVDGDPAP